jgi:hypothetical protein
MGVARVTASQPWADVSPTVPPELRRRLAPGRASAVAEATVRAVRAAAWALSAWAAPGRPSASAPANNATKAISDIPSRRRRRARPGVNGSRALESDMPRLACIANRSLLTGHSVIADRW